MFHVDHKEMSIFAKLGEPISWLFVPTLIYLEERWLISKFADYLKAQQLKLKKVESSLTAGTELDHVSAQIFLASILSPPDHRLVNWRIL